MAAGEDGDVASPPSVYCVVCLADGSLVVYTLPDMRRIFVGAGFTDGRQLLQHDDASSAAPEQPVAAASTNVYVKEVTMESFEVSLRLAEAT